MPSLDHNMTVAFISTLVESGIGRNDRIVHSAGGFSGLLFRTDQGGEYVHAHSYTTRGGRLVGCAATRATTGLPSNVQARRGRLYRLEAWCQQNAQAPVSRVTEVVSFLRPESADFLEGELDRRAVFAAYVLRSLLSGLVIPARVQTPRTATTRMSPPCNPLQSSLRLLTNPKRIVRV